MHRRAHDVEARQHVVGVIERPIRADVDLGADEDPERSELPVETPRFLDPGRDALGTEAVRHSQTRRVVGDRVVRIALVARAPRHGLQRVVPVRPIRVSVEIATHLALRDERWQRVRHRGVDLAVILAQLGRDPGHPERVVDVLLRP